MWYLSKDLSEVRFMKLEKSVCGESFDSVKCCSRWEVNCFQSFGVILPS